MLYVVYRVDRAGARPLREKHRAAHAAYLDATKAVIKVLGPTLSPDGAVPTGTLAILDCADLDAALAWAHDDPYAKAGVFEAITVKPWKLVRGSL